jgi:N-acetylneuraminate synthase/N,N'-diacetyllegionaminate synthase
MIGRVLCLIPARSGSKGLPGKNLCPVGGISLVGRAVLCAREFVSRAGLTDALVMVDTDGEAIAEEARIWGAEVPFLRAPELAADETSTVDSTLSAVERLAAAGCQFDTLVLLQPTSPLRTPDDILACWSRYVGDEADSVVGIAPVQHPIELAITLDEQGVVHWREPVSPTILRRQACPAAFRITGSVYVTSVGALREHRSFTIPGVTRGVELPEARAVDVDTAADLQEAEARLGDRQIAELTIAGHRIGSGGACFIIAEAGVNHNGDIELAHRLVDVAADSGADAVKFQLFNPELLVSPAAPKAEYQIANTGSSESQIEMLQALTLPLDAYRDLQAHAAERGILFLSTAFDETSADFLETLCLDAFKLPSGEVTNHPFLAHLARKGRPLLLSTGMSTLAEVARALEVIRRHGNPPVALFHCVTQYPAPASQCDLRSMETMRRAFGVPVGWSDHTAGLAISLGSVGMGAQLLEKHFTLDRTLPGPDHAASLEPSELKELVVAIREVEASRGTGIKRPAACEVANRELVRRSLFLARRLAPGDVVRAEDLVALRPGTGISPMQQERVVGRVAKVELAPGQRLEWEHLD